ncbi:unnamed protein product, partial [marine sediment metagenome]
TLTTYSNYFDGNIDEIRISNIARSTNWLNTTYETQNDSAAFMSWGIEETIPPTPFTPSDNVSVSDSITFKYKIPFLDSINVTDAPVYEHQINLDDSVSISDSLAMKRLLALADSVSVSDSLGAIKRLLALADSVNITDAIAYKHDINLSDTISVTDSITFKYFLYLLESVSVADSLFIKHLISLTDSVNVTDSFAAKHSIFILDNISILDDVESDFADACGAIFQLHSDTYRVFLPVPEYGGESGSVNNELVLFDFWTNERDVNSIGLNSEP